VQKAWLPVGLPFAFATGLAACGPAPVAQGINDPREAANREVHAANLALDRAVVRPVSRALSGKGGTSGGSGAGPIGQGIGNFADNLGEPGRVVNSLLQLRPGNAAQSTLRFVVNSTVGIGGLFDPASALGVAEKDTDFGETLHVWGAGEGAYVELPLLGPSTERDVVGMVADTLLDPLSLFIPEPERHVATLAKAASSLGDRGRYSDTVDSVLYDSADSYAQARLLYLQNRRFELGQTAPGEAFEDPYEDPYAQ